MNRKIHTIILVIILFCFPVLEAQNKSNDFQIGIYGLQSPVGTKGFQTGKLHEIENDITLVKSDINASIVMRSWNREKYPNWDFEAYFSSYMKDMYHLTNSDGKSGIQVLTPSLYGIFVDPVMDGTNNNEKGFDRYLSREVFKKFIFRILNDEYELVKQKVKLENRTIEILTSETKRPLLGWYLDDEPLIRNHDISAIIEMGWYIRNLEKEFFENHETLSKYPNKLREYYRPRYIAFDGDDLHRHPKSGRKEDAKFYNLNGKDIAFAKNQIYTVFPEDVVDVLLIDFYLPDPLFWNKIINDVEIEYLLTQRVKPKVMPIIFTNFKKKYDSYYNNKFYNDTISQLMKLKVDGIWIYQWQGSKENMGAKDIWKSKEIELNEFVRELSNE